MSYFVGGAIVVSAVAGAVSSNKASKEQSKGVQKGLDQSSALANQARQDVLALFDRSSRNAGIGMKAALDYYKTAAPKRVTPFLQANQQAQNVIGQGSAQANNAILGLPVDMGFVNQPQITANGDHLLGAAIPDYKSIELEQIAAQEAANKAAGKPSQTDLLLTGGGITRSPLDKKMLDPQERIENPLGLSKNLSDKLNPRKALKKLF